MYVLYMLQKAKPSEDYPARNYEQYDSLYPGVFFAKKANHLALRKICGTRLSRPNGNSGSDSRVSLDPELGWRCKSEEFPYAESCATRETREREREERGSRRGKKRAKGVGWRRAKLHCYPTTQIGEPDNCYGRICVRACQNKMKKQKEYGRRILFHAADTKVEDIPKAGSC